MDDKKNIKIGLIISYVNLFASVIFGILVTPIILRNIGDENYGLYSFANSITSWLTVISSALSASYMRFAAQEYKERKTTSNINTVYFKIFLLTAVAVFLLNLIFCSLSLIFHFSFGNYTELENTMITILLFISGLQICANIINTVFTNFCTFNKRFIFLKTLNLVVSVLTHCLNLLFAVVTHSPISLSIIATVLSVLTTLVTLIYAFKNCSMTFQKVSLKEQKKHVRDIVVFSSFLLLNVVVDQINKNLDKTILGVMVDSVSVTYYTLATAFNAYLVVLSTSISSLFVPKIHELVVNNKNNELNELFLKVSTAQMIVIIFIIFGFMSCGKHFIVLWLGNDYIDVFYYSCVLLFIEIVPLTVNFGIEVQRAMNKHKFRAILYIVLALTNVGISIMMILLLPSEKAIWGAIIGTVFSVILGNWFILNLYNKKSVGLPMGRYFANIGKIGLFGIISSVGCIIIDKVLLVDVSNLILKFLICGAIFVFVYLTLLFLFERKTVKDLLLHLK